MCGCFDVSDFVCFFTFFITAIVALLFVQYFFVYLDFETDEKVKTIYLGRCMYFLTLTLLGCLVFAGVQRRSIHLLKWPSRLLVALITTGLICLTLFLWTLDRIHKHTVRDLEIKTIKLSLVILLSFIYLFAVQKLINLLRLARTLTNNAINVNLNLNFVFEHEQQENRPSAPSLVDAFKSQKLKQKTKTCNNSGGNANEGESRRQFNTDWNGINYYKLLLEGGGSKGGPVTVSLNRNESLVSLSNCFEGDISHV